MRSDQKRHWGIFLDVTSDVSLLFKNLLEQYFLPPSQWTLKHNGLVFSKTTLAQLLKEEALHGKNIFDHTRQSLRSMSSGEQKKALLIHLLRQRPDFIILDNPYDHLDAQSQITLKEDLLQLAENTTLIQLIDRKTDTLACITDFITLKENCIASHSNNSCPLVYPSVLPQKVDIPKPLHPITSSYDRLIDFNHVSVSFEGRPILKNIDWSIKSNEFWHLKGPNGSGKTTLLSMITGENSKAFGQDVYLFGQKKGSGESIWDIKEKIGYFSPSMTTSFLGHHSAEHMLISGLYDSIGLYTQPSDRAILLARKWLSLLGMLAYKDTYFNTLTSGQQRMIMTVRAMIKHPLVLILDEPTAGLDDHNAALFVSLVNIIANGSTTSIIFVSHRTEPGLKAEAIYHLKMTPEGAIGSQEIL